MKTCPYCGKEYTDDTTSCPHDGQSLVLIPETNVPTRVLAIASMVLGVLSVLFFCIPFIGIPAVICGHIAFYRSKKKPTQFGGRRLAIAGLATGYLGIVLCCLIIIPDIAYPRMVKTHCFSQLKSIGVAVRLYAGDNNGILPKSFAEMSNELSNPAILLCPADSKHSLPIVSNSAAWDATNVSYEFLLPGMHYDEVTNRIIIRCPIHGYELRGNGLVIEGKTKKLHE